MSDIITHSKYARWWPHLNRRETFDETVTRNKQHHIKQYPFLTDEIDQAYALVYRKRILPSMRSMQFAGKAMELSPNRCFNCVFGLVDDYRFFSEVMFLLLGGSGVGYSVQQQHVAKLPPITKPSRNRRFVVGDSIEGWADAIKVLIKAYLKSGSKPRYDFSDIRLKGAPLKTSGGKAPGPQPLEKCLFLIGQIFETKEEGSKLSPLECHDILCHIANAVLAGGIRRSAMICLFSFFDQEMRSCKAGNWRELNPQRGRANNSATALRGTITEEDFWDLFRTIKANRSGEPGLYLTNNLDWGLNPCGEASLRPFQGCNLTEINGSAITTQEELNEAAQSAALIGTLQASYTDFHYLRPVWSRQFKRDALLGIGITGLANKQLLSLDLSEAALIAREENSRVAELLGINKAARITLIKPSGTTSLLLGTSSGIHAWHSKYYIRRVTVLKTEPLYQYLIDNIPELIVDSIEKPDIQALVEIPIKAPEGAIVQSDETPIDLLQRIERVYQDWIKPGHRHGDNSHSISCTINIRDNEWEEVGKWMWENKEKYNCLALFPHYGGTHEQLPHEECTQEKYEELLQHVQQIDLTEIVEWNDDTDLTGELACGAGGCVVT